VITFVGPTKKYCLFGFKRKVVEFNKLISVVLLDIELKDIKEPAADCVVVADNFIETCVKFNEFGGIKDITNPLEV